MLNRHLSVVACACVAAVAISYGQVSPGNSYVFQTPGTGAAGSTVAVYNNVSKR